MALDDVIKSVKKSRGAERILARAMEDPGFNAGSEMAIYDGLGRDDPEVSVMSSNAPAWHRDYVQRAVGEYQNRVVDAAQANLADIWGAYGDPKKTAAYLTGRPVVATGSTAIDGAHKKAFETTAALRDENAIGKFIAKRVDDLENKAKAGNLTFATANAVAFSLNQNPGIARQAIMTAAAQAREQLQTELGATPQAYLETRYNAMD